MGHFFSFWKHLRSRSGRHLDMVQLASINNGSLLGNLDYGREAVVLFLNLNWRNCYKKWLTIVSLGSGRFAFGQMQKLGNVNTTFFIKKSSEFLFFLHQKNTKVDNSTRNHYGCTAVSTIVASLFHLKRHKRFLF